MERFRQMLAVLRRPEDDYVGPSGSDRSSEGASAAAAREEEEDSLAASRSAPRRLSGKQRRRGEPWGGGAAMPAEERGTAKNSAHQRAIAPGS